MLSICNVVFLYNLLIINIIKNKVCISDANLIFYTFDLQSFIQKDNVNKKTGYNSASALATPSSCHLGVEVAPQIPTESPSVNHWGII